MLYLKPLSLMSLILFISCSSNPTPVTPSAKEEKAHKPQAKSVPVKTSDSHPKQDPETHK